jgi:hypothetical protein
MKSSTTITLIFLLLVSAANLLALIFQVKVTANTVEIPIWMHVLECIFAIVLASWLFIENKKQEKRYE